MPELSCGPHLSVTYSIISSSSPFPSLTSQLHAGRSSPVSHNVRTGRRLPVVPLAAREVFLAARAEESVSSLREEAHVLHHLLARTDPWCRRRVRKLPIFLLTLREAQYQSAPHASRSRPSRSTEWHTVGERHVNSAANVGLLLSSSYS